MRAKLQVGSYQCKNVLKLAPAGVCFHPLLLSSLSHRGKTSLAQQRLLSQRRRRKRRPGLRLPTFYNGRSTHKTTNPEKFVPCYTVACCCYKAYRQDMTMPATQQPTNILILRKTQPTKRRPRPRRVNPTFGYFPPSGPGSQDGQHERDASRGFCWLVSKSFACCSLRLHVRRSKPVLPCNRIAASNPGDWRHLVDFLIAKKHHGSCRSLNKSLRPQRIDSEN